ncbi:MAG: hypothetical protein MUF44_14380, partial [Hydrogenophaga sp.]|nr:hypothetical protein [Hydrogenophaga sp.]
MTPGRAARALMADDGTTGRAGMGAAATPTAGATGAGAGDIWERTMGLVAGNSVSELRRRGFAAGTMGTTGAAGALGAMGNMGIWLLCRGSVAAKPR